VCYQISAWISLDSAADAICRLIFEWLIRGCVSYLAAFYDLYTICRAKPERGGFSAWCNSEIRRGCIGAFFAFCDVLHCIDADRS
jgi:hypothetical protein